MKKKLVLVPKKISYKNSINIFLENFFLKLVRNNKYRNSNKFFVINNKSRSLKSQLNQIKLKNKIYSIILKEIHTKLNSIHKINWQIKTWEFLIGHWLHFYIETILDRLSMINPLFKFNNKIDVSDQLIFGKNPLIVTNTLREFTEQIRMLDWNNRLISRLLYLKHTNDFNKNYVPLLKANSHIIKENIIKKFIFTIKINMLKILSFIFSWNTFIFYNSYIKDKYKLIKIIFSLKSFPFPYSFSFFNNKIVNSKLDIELRKSIELNYHKEKNFRLKVIKYLLIETFPKIYLEGFKYQSSIAKNSHLPKKIDGVFTCSAYEDNSFKFWLADKINLNKKVFFGSHGAGYQIFSKFFHEKYELKFSKKYFVWGKNKSHSKNVSIGNFLISDEMKKKPIFKFEKYLIMLPLFSLYTRKSTSIDFSRSREKDVRETQSFFNNLTYDVKKILEIRAHPGEYRHEFSVLNFVNYNKSIIKKIDLKKKFENIRNDYSLFIFPYLSTEFLISLSIDRPCLIYFNKTELKKFNKSAKNYFLKLHSIEILHFSGKSLAKKINSISGNINKWWENEQVNKIKRNFCDKYSNSKFNEKLFINSLKN